MKKIVWLASYPKSGNTWVRAFLTCLMKKNTNNYVNNLIAPIISERYIYDNELCIETSDLTINEIESLRPFVADSLCSSIEPVPFFFKVHDAYTYTDRNESLFPVDISIGGIYIIRNPLDVAVSFSHHSNMPIDTIINIMSQENYGFNTNANKISLQIQQKLLSWHSHVKSWTLQTEIPVMVIKYEDMINDSFETFKNVVSFSNLYFNDDQIKKAIELTSFKNLQKNEKEEGFREKSPNNKTLFFRKGKIGSWKEELNKEQIDRLIADHKEVMCRYNYIDSSGNPII